MILTIADKNQFAEKEEKTPLYESVARRVADLIEQGTYAPGGRVPSLRKLSKQMQVSLTTVLEAYRLLEDWGLLEPLPQSGFYVRNRAPETARETPASQDIGVPIDVSMGELVMRVMRDTLNPALLQFSAALPNPALLPSEKLSRLLGAEARRAPHRSDFYEIPPGCEELRIQIARRAVATGCSFSPEEVVLTSGCQEAIMLCLRTLCRPGDIVAVETPTYFNFLQAIELLGLRAFEIPTHPVDGMKIDALAQAIASHPIRTCLLSTNFSNPQGSSLPEANRQALVALLAQHEIPLIEDDIYGDLRFSGTIPRLAKAFDTKGLVLLCSSFSKTLAPGYRIGWVSPGRFQAQIEHLKFVSNIAVSTPPALAIAAFLASSGYDSHLRQVRRAYAAQMGAMSDAITRHFPSGTRVSHPAGGFILWVECPKYVDSLALYEQAVQAGVTLAPGLLFSAQDKYRNCIRLNSAYWSPEAEDALAILGRLSAAMGSSNAFARSS